MDLPAGDDKCISYAEFGFLGKKRTILFRQPQGVQTEEPIPAYGFLLEQAGKVIGGVRQPLRVVFGEMQTMLHNNNKNKDRMVSLFPQPTKPRTTGEKRQANFAFEQSAQVLEQQCATQ